MREKRLKKNSFIQGTIIASVAMIFIKVLGALYVIPYYKIVGQDGGTLYSYAYSIYNLFLNISTAGIPVAMSMVISEYVSLEMFDAKERSYKIGRKVVALLAIICFACVFFGSKLLAGFILGDATGGHTIEDVSLVIKAISPCLLIIPFLSLCRGYLQGHKFIKESSAAQVIEQVVRILFVIVGSYVAIKVFNSDIPTGVGISLLGTFFGGLVSYVYLKSKIVKHSDSFGKPTEKDQVTDKQILGKIITYCIPLIICSITSDLYGIIDIKLIIKGLRMVGYDTINAETISSILSTWAPKISTVIATIGVALTTNVIPHVTGSFVCNDMKGVIRRVNQAISCALLITVPMAMLLFLLSDEAYFIFYGESNYGSLALKVVSILQVLFAVTTVLTSSLQSMKKFKMLYISVVLGLVINTIFDIPFILFLDYLGLNAYVGTSVSSCLGQIISMTICILYLKKNMNFNFKYTLNVLKGIVLPLVCMIVPIVISKIFITFEMNFVNAFISLLIHGLLGVIIYFVVSYKNGLLVNVVGEDYLDKIKGKLHLEK